MPNHIGTWHLLAWTHLMKNNIDQAKDAFDKAYDLDRNFGETHGGLASIYALQGNKELAEKHIKIANRLDPLGFSSIYAQMVLLNLDGRPQEAQNLFEKVKNTEHEVLGTTPNKLIETRLAELASQQQRTVN